MEILDTGLKRVRIFVSSPGDVREERKITEDVLGFLQAEFSSHLCIDPLFWENEVQYVHNDFQSNIEPPSKSDLFICILWSRLGTRLHPQKYQREDGSAYLSGTEFEFEDAINAFKKSKCPHIVLFKNEAEISIPDNPPNEFEEKTYQRRVLAQFFEKWTKDEEYSDIYTAGFNAYENLLEFKEKLTKFLRNFFNTQLPSGTIVQKNISWKGSPFRGLEHFDFEHAPIFKGRSATTGEVFIRLKQQFKANKPFMLIGGSSGVGKSSLVRAGLLRLLLNQSQEWNTVAWRYAELRPSDIRKENNENDFFDVLARAMTQKREAKLNIVDGAQTLRTPPTALPELLEIYKDVSTLGKVIREDIDDLVKNIKICLENFVKQFHNTEKQSGQVEVRLCLFLDQMEEFFTTPCSTQENINAFFHALRKLVEEKVLIVVGTIRADYLNYCEEIPDLQFLKDGNSYYHLSPPSTNDVGVIIREPAQAAGITFESNDEQGALDELIRLDALSYDKFGQNLTVLPLLEFTLTELYEKANQQQKSDQLQLTFADYNEMGGLKGAIATKADLTFQAFKNEFPKDADKTFSQVMYRLITGTQEGIFSRKKALYEEFDTKESKAFVDILIDSRLLSIDIDENNNKTIYIVHEALLYNWEHLRKWLKQEQENFAMLQRLKANFNEWQKEYSINSKRHIDLLLPSGKPLQDAEYLRDANYLLYHEDILLKEILHFIYLSKRHAERQKRRLYMLIAGLVIGFVLSVIGGVTAFTMFKEAKKQEQKAVMARNDAEKLIEFMLIDLRDKLGPLGQLSIMDTLYKEVENYYENQKDSADLSILQKQAILLTQQADVLRDQGRNEEALELYQKSFDMRKKLVAKDANNMIWQRDLAISFRKIADVFKAQGNSEQALQYNQKSLKIVRKLVAYKANSTLFQSDLSVNLEKIGDVFVTQGDNEQALHYYQESLNIMRKLVAHDANNIEWQSDLSVSLGKIGDIFKAKGNSEQALQHYQESLKIMRKLVARDASNTDLQRNLVSSLTKTGNIFVAQGNSEQALQYYQESLNIMRKLVAHDASNTNWQKTLVTVFVNVGDIFVIQGNNEQALQYFQEGLDIIRKLVSHDASNMNWQNSLATLLQKVGDIDIILNKNKDKALQYYQESLEIKRKLVAHDENNTTWQRDITYSLQRIGKILQTQGKYEQALQYYQENLEISRKLVAHDAGNVTLQSDLFIPLLQLGDILKTQSKYEQALQYYQKNLEIGRKLVAHDANNTSWQRVLSVSFERIGDIFKAQSKPEQALQYYQKSLEIRRKLVAHDANNMNWQWALYESFIKIGDIFKIQRKHEQALQYYQDSLETMRKLVADNANNTTWQRELSISLLKVGDIFRIQGNNNQALQYYQESLEILLKLVAHDENNAKWQWSIVMSYVRLASIYKNDSEKKKTYIEKAITILHKLVKVQPSEMRYRRALERLEKQKL